MSINLQKDIRQQYENYCKTFSDEVKTLELLEKQVGDDASLNDRKNMTGHATASGLVISPDSKVLLIWHNAHERYQQPGGHIDDDDADVISAAKREVIEETGLSDIRLHPWHTKSQCPINIDTHSIPARSEKKELDHFHHDYLFIFTTPTKDINLQQEEVSDWKWTPIEDVVKQNGHVATGIRRARKLTLI